jgi:predicted dehydrogenase
MNKPLCIGLIGAGTVSRHHLIAWAQIADQARVIAVPDPSHDNAAQRAAVSAERRYDLAAEYQGSYDRAIAHFVQSLRDHSSFETAPNDNLETLRLVEDCYRLSGWEATQ